MEEKKFNMFAEFKAVKEDNGATYVEGYASTFNEDLDGETIDQKAFDETLNDYKMNPVVLANHTNTVESVVGQTVDAKVDSNGLFVKVKLSNSDDPFTKMVREKVKEGLLRAFSIGGLFQYDYPTIKKVKLLEISIVPIPANSYSLFSMAKAWKGMEIEDRKQIEEPNQDSNQEKNEESKEVLDGDGVQLEESGNELDESKPQETTSDPVKVDYREQVLKELTNIYLNRGVDNDNV
jgi:HK97 family phage prohead protease